MTTKRRHHPTPTAHPKRRKGNNEGADPAARPRQPGGNGVETDLDSLDTMTGRLDTTRGKVSDVGDAVRNVNVGPESMGMLGAGFTSAAEAHLRAADDHVVRTSTAVEQAQAGTRATTRAYRETDVNNANQLAVIDPTPAKTPATNPQAATPASTRTGAGEPPSQPRSISGTLDDDGGKPATPPPPPPPPRQPPKTPATQPAGKIQHYDPSGQTIRTDNLTHPDAHLLDQSLLSQAANNPNRVGDALRPGVDMRHPAVQAIVPNTYHRDGFDANGNPMSRARWDQQYWPTGSYDTHGGRDLTWPDPQPHPEGFSSPQDRGPAVLQPGQQIDRFGPGFGRFASPTDTPFPERGLPPDNLYDMRNPANPGVNPNGPAPSYHRYEVIKPIPVWEGPIAPAMGQPGGGVQFYTPRAIIDLVNAGYLREVPL